MDGLVVNVASRRHWLTSVAVDATPMGPHALVLLYMYYCIAGVQVTIMSACMLIGFEASLIGSWPPKLAVSQRLRPPPPPSGCSLAIAELNSCSHV